MKIPLQEKIAELESRVEALEKGRTVRVTTTTEKVEVSKVFGEHWDKMWAEFNEVMKAAFRR